jgi:hypothetical protein
MTMPNFLIIGAAKSGTTSLWDGLSGHPQVFMPREPKEANFFALEGRPAAFRGPGDDRCLNCQAVTDPVRYRALFSGADGVPARGEASPLYLYHPEAPVRIRAQVPDVKLVVILRNPVDRAFSSFLHLVRDGREPIHDFPRALAEEPRRIAEGWEHLWHYTQMGFYARQLARYHEHFDAAQIRVYLYEDLCRDPDALTRDLCEFLGIDPEARAPLPRRNTTGHVTVNRSGLVRDLVYRDNALKAWAKSVLAPGLVRRARNVLLAYNRTRPRLSTAVRRRLTALFREDVERLEAMIGRDLGAWKGAR